MPRKTPEEIHEYVLNYKNKLLGQYNESMESLHDHANTTDIKLGSDLILIASASLAVMGGLVVSKTSLQVEWLKWVLSFSALVMIISIIGGLKYYADVSVFWKRWGDIKNEQAKMVHEDESRTVEDLDVLLGNVQTKGLEAPTRSKTVGRRVQVYAFGAGIIGLSVVIVGYLFQ